MPIRAAAAAILFLYALLAKAQTPPVIVPCGEDRKMQQAYELVEGLASNNTKGFEIWLDPSVRITDRQRIREDLANAVPVVARLYQAHELSVVRIYPEADESIFRCRFQGNDPERFRMDIHYRTSDCSAGITAIRIDREPPVQNNSEQPPPPPPPPSFIIRH
ncbi:MAG: hypothetical protein KF797_15365 [Flavobacteriales bacterium]|nr:hypothetical protein [Flavobacteriales bacterium]